MKMIPRLIFFCFFPAIAVAADTQNWQVVIAEDPLSNKPACLLVSTTKKTEDGQASTPLKITYNGKAWIAETKSNIDLSYPDLGLQVDYHKAYPVDRIHKKNSVVFETQAGPILDEFIHGLSGKLTLGFWPTWPKTKNYTTEFDLRGFTKTYETFEHCQKTGEIL